MPIAFCFRLFAVVCCIVVAIASVVVVVVYSIKFHLNANEKLPEERKKAQRGESCCASFFSPFLKLYNTRKIVSDCLPTLFVRMPPVCICVCVCVWYLFARVARFSHTAAVAAPLLLHVPYSYFSFHFICSSLLLLPRLLNSLSSFVTHSVSVLTRAALLFVINSLFAVATALLHCSRRHPHSRPLPHPDPRSRAHARPRCLFCS